MVPCDTCSSNQECHSKHLLWGERKGKRWCFREEGELSVFSARLKVFVFEIANGSIRVVIVEKFNSLTPTSD